jgi:hypothetical protein
MSRIPLRGPLFYQQELNTGDALERGDSPKFIVESVEAMFTELYGQNTTTAADIDALEAADVSLDARLDAIEPVVATHTTKLAQAGVASIDFGAYPGTFDTSLAITGQTGILTGSVLQAEVIATATADHSVDEVWVDRPIVVAGSISAGVGFTIYATARDGGRAYGLYTVHWKWI